MSNETDEEVRRLLTVIEREVVHLDVHQRIVLAREIEDSLNHVPANRYRERYDYDD